MTDTQREAARAWFSPAIILPAIAFAGGLYVSSAIQEERVEALRSKVEAIERDYQRRDVLAGELRTIDMRLTGIEMKLDRQSSSSSGGARR